MILSLGSSTTQSIRSFNSNQLGKTFFCKEIIQSILCMIIVLETNSKTMSGESTNTGNLNYKHENLSLVRECVSIEITKIFI